MDEGPSRKILAKNLRRLMLQRGQSPAVFAMRAKMAARSLDEIMEGSSVPTIDLLDRMAAALGVTAADLLTEPKDA